MHQLFIGLEKSSLKHLKVLARSWLQECGEGVCRVWGGAVTRHHHTENVGSRNLHHLFVERREKHLSRDWLLEVAAQVENVSKQLTNLFSFFSG